MRRSSAELRRAINLVRRRLAEYDCGGGEFQIPDGPSLEARLDTLCWMAGLSGTDMDQLMRQLNRDDVGKMPAGTERRFSGA